VGFFEIRDFVFDFEDGVEDGGSDEVDFVGDFGEGLEGIEHSGGNRGKVGSFAAGDVFFADLDGGGGLGGLFALSFGILDDGAVVLGDV